MGTSGAPSALTYTGSVINSALGDLFDFGTLTYFNGAINAGSGADSVDLSVEIMLTQPDDIMNSFTFDLSLINTLNTGDANASADIVNFDNSVASEFFTFGGVQYTLEFLGFGTPSGDGFTVENSFSVLEDGTANVQLFGRITAVSEPSIVAILALCLIGIGIRRFK
jgi:hypothetical protein